eukprot:TRINITY_DN41796_c0_g1_i1.p1 TRINITY_DN41796_c0_g1~~TRINITY_DN41796_c0_g1_i1.p1  ORF type:complete len:227 (+),score=13.88 TRINITY_DN41796_c0_g1_i1:45-725(+)
MLMRWPTSGCAMTFIVSFAEFVGNLYIVASFNYVQLCLIFSAHVAVSFMRLVALVAFVYFPGWFTELRAARMCAAYVVLSWGLFFLSVYVKMHLDDFLADPELAHDTWMKLRIGFFAFCSFSNGSIALAIHAGFRVPEDHGVHRKALVALQRATLRKYSLAELASSKADNQDVCVVCLSPMVAAEMITELTCRHRFHTACVETWATSQVRLGISTLCPMRCSPQRT